jgi:signal transduction histidine kinase
MTQLADRPGSLPGARRSDLVVGSPGNTPKRVSESRSQQLLELAGKLTGARLGGVGLVSAEGTLVEHLTVGISEEAAAAMARSAGLTSLIRWLLQQPGPVRVGDLAACQPHLGPIEAGFAVGPLLGLPLHCPGRYQGALYLARTPDDAPFGPADLRAIEPIRTWLEQASLYEEVHLLAQLRLLKGVAQTAAGNLDLGLILARALRELDRHLPLHVCVVWLTDDAAPGQLTLAATNAIPNTRAADLGLLAGMQYPVNRTPFQDCLDKGEALYSDLLHDDATLPPVFQTPLAQGLAAYGATCFFATPLRSGDRTVGILQSISTRPTGLNGEQIQLLYLVADLLGPAISNCRLFERLRTTYEQLQATQEQLIRVEKMRALGELASGMAHDFNNALCGVLGFLELSLMDKALSASNRAYLESARTCALDAAQTVRRVQEFARWRRRDPVFQPLDLNDLVRQTIELTRHKWESLSRARTDPIAVEVQAEATALVSGGAAELREVLTNLVFNAVDAMPKGGALALRTWSTPDDVLLSVRDTGVGMSPAVRQRLFEPFFTTKGDRGNGMGLSVAYGIIQGHGGAITVASEVDRGTTFTIRLPALGKGSGTARGPKPAAAEAVSLSPCSRVLKGPRRRVLVVEDEESVRSFLGTLLDQLGHRTRLVGDAEQGLAALAEGPFDLVLTDLGLPGMSGEELARTIAVRFPRLPVVLLTGWAEQLRTEVDVLPGVARILGKPVTINALVEALDAVCPRS